MIITSMFTLLLLVSHVTGEWVEIAQNHYRKEPSRRITGYEDTTKANRIYINHSITERPWNRGVVTRIPSVGNIKRVQMPSKTKDEFTIGMFYDNIENINFNGQYGPVRAPNLKNTKNSETINVKRKYNDNTRDALGETIVKTNTHVPSQYSIRRTLTPNNTPNIFKSYHKETIDKNKSQIIKISNSPKYETLDFTVDKNPHIERDQNVADVNEHTINDSDKDSRLYLNKNSVKVNIRDNFNKIKIAEDIDIPANNEMDEDKKVSSKNSLKIQSKTNNDENKSKVTSSLNKRPMDYNITEMNKSNLDKIPGLQMEIKNATNIFKMNEQHNDQETKNESNKIGNNTKNNIEVLWNFMKLVTDNISRNTRRSFKGKIKYLEILRNNILSNIEERIEQAWPDDGQRRRRRSARGHVEFPSSESALMTISFLTFAMFLIKLVLQVIHTYKNKTMMVTPAVVAAVGRAAGAFREQTSN
ncbi:uncharacterized protein [Epargyreus clarus]|uniref:uncharacterized protein n=1 Tax=Epargyreus clarus TaxID=520877 RepID=UPI003C2C6B40